MTPFLECLLLYFKSLQLSRNTVAKIWGMLGNECWTGTHQSCSCCISSMKNPILKKKMKLM